MTWIDCLLLYEDFEDQWNAIDELLQQWEYKSDEKKIIEKIDEEHHYAAIHYAVQANNKELCKKLLDKYKCGKAQLLSMFLYKWFSLSLYFSRCQFIRI